MATKKILYIGNNVVETLSMFMIEDETTDEIEKKFDKIISQTHKKKGELKVRDQDTDMLCVEGALVEREKNMTDTAWRNLIETYCFQFDDDYDVYIVEVE